MKVLFVHQNFPGQYLYLAQRLARNGDEIVALSSRKGVAIPGIRIINYDVPTSRAAGTHPYLKKLEDAVVRGERAAECAMRLRASGFDPDLVCVHPGWGEGLYLRDVWKNVPQLHYCEYYFSAFTGASQFRPREPVGLDDVFRTRTRNAIALLSLDAADAGVAPMHWQQAQFPAAYRTRIRVAHEGVNVALCKPNADAVLTLANGRRLSRGDHVVTYVSRSLEPTRGFPEFMRAAALLLSCRPDVEIVVVGGEDVSYGPPPPTGGSWREALLQEVDVDPDRIHFLGKVPYEKYLSVLQISSAHVYLTVPFVLSWSFLEAMAVGCLMIGSDTEPVREVIEDGVSGLLVDFFDAQGLARTLEQAIDGGPAFEKMRERARRVVTDRYSLAQCMPRQLELVDEVSRLR